MENSLVYSIEPLCVSVKMNGVLLDRKGLENSAFGPPQANLRQDVVQGPLPGGFFPYFYYQSSTCKWLSSRYVMFRNCFSKFLGSRATETRRLI
jgi:hypothetical protein